MRPARAGRTRLLSCLGFGLFSLAGCGGRHLEEYTRPENIADFDTLFNQNCRGCHGNDGRNGAAQALNDSLYQHLAGKDQIRKTIMKGREPTPMPPFSKAEGGYLTDAQIGILVDGMQQKWGAQEQSGLPVYAVDAAVKGDAQRGEAAYKTYCSGCHGPDGNGGPKGGSILDPNYLSLVTDQYVRTTVIAGRPDLQIPDYRNYVSGHPMSEQEISDVVAWVVSHRSNNAVVGRAPRTTPGDKPLVSRLGPLPSKEN